MVVIQLALCFSLSAFLRSTTYDDVGPSGLYHSPDRSRILVRRYFENPALGQHKSDPRAKRGELTSTTKMSLHRSVPVRAPYRRNHGAELVVPNQSAKEFRWSGKHAATFLAAEKRVSSWPAHRARIEWLICQGRIRHRAVRMFVTFAAENLGTIRRQDWLNLRSVVYVAIHLRSTKFYIGETSRTAMERLTEHFHKRLSTDGTKLSQHMAFRSRVHSSADGLVSEYVIFPLLQVTGEVLRREVERKLIIRFKCKKMLNVPPALISRRLRHTQMFPIGPPASGTGRNVVQTAVASLAQCGRIVEHLEKLNLRSRVRALSKFSTGKLVRVRNSLPLGVPIRKLIQDTLQTRLERTAEFGNERLVFSVFWNGHGFAKIPVKKLILETPSPIPRKLLEKVLVSWKCRAPIARSIRNATQASIQLPEASASVMSADPACDCQNMIDKLNAGEDVPYSKDDFSCGHVCTPEANVLRDFIPADEFDGFKELWMQGSKFRFSLSDFEVAASVSDAVKNFAERITKFPATKSIARESIKDWCNELQANMLDALFLSQPSRKTFPRIQLGKLMQRVHEEFVITACDKNPQASAVICKTFYNRELRKMLCSETYSHVGQAKDVLDTIFETVGEFAKSIECESTKLLPYLYIIPKIHRLEPHRAPLRPIAGKSRLNVLGTVDRTSTTGSSIPRSPDTTLTDMGRGVAVMLDSCIDLLKLRDSRNAIKRCWIVRTVEEALEVCTHLDVDNTTVLRTDDFTNMYTCLPHTELIAGVWSAIDDAVQELATRHACSFDDATRNCRFSGAGVWTLSTDPTAWPIDRLKSAVKFIIEHTFVMNGFEVFRQVIGIAMGENPSPPMSTMYLYVKERNFVNRMIADKGEEYVLRECQGFRFVSRFIDDRFANLPAEKLPGPNDYDDLAIRCTGEGRTVTFLSISIKADPNLRKVTFELSDKQKSFPHRLVRFPSMASCIPNHIRTGTVITMLVRAWRYCSLAKDFFGESKELFQRFVERGYTKTQFYAAIDKFCDRNTAPEYRSDVASKLKQLCNVLPGARRSAAQMDALLPPQPAAARVDNVPRSRTADARPPSAAADVPRRRTLLNLSLKRFERVTPVLSDAATASDAPAASPALPPSPSPPASLPTQDLLDGLLRAPRAPSVDAAIQVQQPTPDWVTAPGDLSDAVILADNPCAALAALGRAMGGGDSPPREERSERRALVDVLDRMAERLGSTTSATQATGDMTTVLSQTLSLLQQSIAELTETRRHQDNQRALQLFSDQFSQWCNIMLAAQSRSTDVIGSLNETIRLLHQRPHEDTTSIMGPAMILDCVRGTMATAFSEFSEFYKKEILRPTNFINMETLCNTLAGSMGKALESAVSSLEFERTNAMVKLSNAIADSIDARNRQLTPTPLNQLESSFQRMLQAFGEQQNFLRSATRIDTEAIAATVSGAMSQQLTHAFTFLAENQRALIAALPLSEPRREDRPLTLINHELREEVRQLVQLELRDRQREPEVSAAMPQLLDRFMSVVDGQLAWQSQRLAATNDFVQDFCKGVAATHQSTVMMLLQSARGIRAYQLRCLAEENPRRPALLEFRAAAPAVAQATVQAVEQKIVRPMAPIPDGLGELHAGNRYRVRYVSVTSAEPVGVEAIYGEGVFTTEDGRTIRVETVISVALLDGASPPVTRRRTEA